MMGRVQNLILKGFASSFEALRLIVRSSEKTMKKRNKDVFCFWLV